jgi:hypothetical protein
MLLSLKWTDPVFSVRSSKSSLSLRKYYGQSDLGRILRLFLQQVYVCCKATRVISLSVSPCVFFFSLLFPSWS